MTATRQARQKASWETGPPVPNLTVSPRLHRRRQMRRPDCRLPIQGAKDRFAWCRQLGSLIPFSRIGLLILKDLLASLLAIF